MENNVSLTFTEKLRTYGDATRYQTEIQKEIVVMEHKVKQVGMKVIAVHVPQPTYDALCLGLYLSKTAVYFPFYESIGPTTLKIMDIEVYPSDLSHYSFTVKERK